VSEALLVLNPRHIPECIEAIQSLGIPTCWLSYMTERQAAEAANQQIADTDYDRYLVLSDDTVPTRQALDRVLATADQGHPVVTGYCNLDEADNRHLVNLCTDPLPPPPPDPESYSMMSRAVVDRKRKPFRTTFAGLALTLLTRDMWTRYPLEISPNGGQVDYMLSYNLAQAGVPIVATPKAFVRHVKEHWNLNDEHPDKQLLVGQRPGAIIWT
jgi:hypothetical protein